MMRQNFWRGLGGQYKVQAKRPAGRTLFSVLKYIKMSILPKIEKLTKDATFTHFFLMFGYKLFSFYFPLFLVARGLSLPEVGYTYLLIYLPLAFFAPLAGFLNHSHILT